MCPRSIEDKATSKSDDGDENKDSQIFESVLPPPALLPLNLDSGEEVTDTEAECGCIEKYKLEEADPANSTTLQGKGTHTHHEPCLPWHTWP